MEIRKVKAGYNPYKIYCNPDESVSAWAADWKNVTCKECWKKYKAKLRPFGGVSEKETKDG